MDRVPLPFRGLNLWIGISTHQPDEDGRALLELLSADGSGAASEEIRGRFGWDAERYARACVRLEERGYVQAGQGRAETVYRDLTAVPPEFRPACGRPGSRVTVRQVPVTVPHALCDLTGVTLSYPCHGGAVVPSPGYGVGNSKGIQVQVDARTLDAEISAAGQTACVVRLPSSEERLHKTRPTGRLTHPLPL